MSWETPQDSCNPPEQYPTQSKQDLSGAVHLCLRSRQAAPGSDTAVLLRSLWATAHLENKAPDLGEKPTDDTGAGNSRDLGAGMKVLTLPQADLWSRDLGGRRFQELMIAKHSSPPGSFFFFPSLSPISQSKLKCCYISLEEMSPASDTAGNDLRKKKGCCCPQCQDGFPRLG